MLERPTAPDPLAIAFGSATVLRSRELEARGISRNALRRAGVEGRVERVARGLYALPGAPFTENHSLALVAGRVGHARISLLSALRFHGLTTQNPRELWITIAQKARTPVVDGLPLRVVRCSPVLLDEGCEFHEIEGVEVPVYSVARTLVDLFRHRNKLGIDVALEALREAWRDRRFTLKELNRIAGKFRMTRVMKPYLESLLS